MSADDIGFSVAALTDGAFVDEFFQGDDKIDIFLYSQAGSEQQLDRVDRPPDLRARGRGGAAGQHGPGGRDRRYGRDATHQRPAYGDAEHHSASLGGPGNRGRPGPTEVIQDARRGASATQSVSVDISGASDQLMATRAALAGNYVVAIVLSVLVLVAIFNHWGWPLGDLTAVPLGIAGGMAGSLAVGDCCPHWVFRRAPALRHDHDARLPDSARCRRQQPDPDRR
jgi:hypothetical protein